MQHVWHGTDGRRVYLPARWSRLHMRGTAGWHRTLAVHNGLIIHQWRPHRWRRPVYTLVSPSLIAGAVAIADLRRALHED